MQKSESVMSSKSELNGHMQKKRKYNVHKKRAEWTYAK